MFVVVGWLWARVETRPAWLGRAFVYALGSIAAFWSLERGLAMLSW